MPTFTLRSHLLFGTGEFDQTVALKVSSTFQRIAPFWFVLILECCHQCYGGFFIEPFSSMALKSMLQVFKLRKTTRWLLHKHHDGVVLAACDAAELRASSFVFLPLAALISSVIEMQKS